MRSYKLNRKKSFNVYVKNAKITLISKKYKLSTEVKSMKKKWLAALFLNVILVISGCSAGEMREKKGSQKQGEQLTLVTEKMYEGITKDIVRYYMSQHPGKGVKVTYLPTEPQERETKFQKLRTEMMSGKGADLYVLGNPDEQIDASLRNTQLFTNVSKSMQSGVFASLNEYMEEDAYWKDGDYQKSLLGAGQYEGRQYIIPLACEYYVFASPQENNALQGETLEEWYENALNSDNMQMRDAVVAAVDDMSSRWQQVSVDYETQKVNFDKQTWSSFMKKVLLQEEQNVQENPYMLGKMEIAGMLGRTAGTGGYRYQAVPNQFGNKMASITVYGGIGMSSEQKEEAYELLMYFADPELYAKKQTSYTSIGVGDFPVSESGVKNYLNAHYQIYDETVIQAVLESFRELDSGHFVSQADYSFYDLTGGMRLQAERDASPTGVDTLVAKIAEQAEEEYTILVKE